MVASGPFFTADSVSEDPLTELTVQCGDLAPHVVILFGPFLDEKHVGVNSVSARQLDTLLMSKIEEIKKVGSEVLLVPSMRDFFADPVLPTPVIDEPDFTESRKFMSGDPIAAAANGWRTAGTSNDVVLQIMKSELSSNQPGEKFARVSRPS